METVKFISHASICVTVDEVSLLCDPWFFGKVFDDSWCLIEEPDLNSLDFNRIKYVWISHEHPDHLNLPTLKFLADKLPQDVLFIYRDQPNKKVVNDISELGFQVMELAEGEKLSLPHFGHVTSYVKNASSALLIETPAHTVLNMNDCMLTKKKCHEIMKYVSGVDYLFCQFSLAGFSGNPSDTTQLQAEKEYHLRKIREYYELFNPKYFIPFASFVTFCTDYNRYLNQWRITLNDVVREIPTDRLQILFNGDDATMDRSHSMSRSSVNLERWQALTEQQEIPLTSRPVIATEEIRLACEKLVSLFKGWPVFSYPWSLSINLVDKNCSVLLDFYHNKVRISESLIKRPVVELSSYSFLNFINNPWGADTLNISAEARVFDLRKWRWFLYCKHFLYKPVSSGRLAKFIPRIYALVKPLLMRIL